MKLKKIKKNRYISEASTDYALDLLKLIFEDIGCKPDFFIDALRKTEWNSLGTNLCYLNKKDNRIVIGYEYAQKDHNYEFELEINHLIEILEKWGQLCQQGVDEIIMKRTGDRVVLEGKKCH